MFNSCKALSFSGVELYLAQHLWESDLHYCLWAYLNSSFAWLFREATGRRNLGGGLLKAEATDMKALPIDFVFNFGSRAKDVFDSLKGRQPLPVLDEVYTEEHVEIDNIVSEFLGISEWTDSIRDVLVEQVETRLAKAKSGRRNN